MATATTVSTTIAKSTQTTTVIMTTTTEMLSTSTPTVTTVETTTHNYNFCDNNFIGYSYNSFENDCKINANNKLLL